MTGGGEMYLRFDQLVLPNRVTPTRGRGAIIGLMTLLMLRSRTFDAGLKPTLPGSYFTGSKADFSDKVGLSTMARHLNTDYS
jgi:hypothetical protein